MSRERYKAGDLKSIFRTQQLSDKCSISPARSSLFSPSSDAAIYTTDSCHHGSDWKCSFNWLMNILPRIVRVSYLLLLLTSDPVICKVAGTVYQNTFSHPKQEMFIESPLSGKDSISYTENWRKLFKSIPSSISLQSNYNTPHTHTHTHTHTHGIH